jgi:type II secretory pathway predicted ATPase ExeA/cell division protein FtsN
VSRSDPSSNHPASGPLFETDSRRGGLTRLTDGLGARGAFLVVSGDAGTGKTLLAREAISRWGAHAAVAHVVNTAMTRAEFLEEILRCFRLDPPASATKPQLLDRLQRHIAECEGHDRVPVIVIDDAHEIRDELLGELRLLTNAAALAHQPLEIMLVGLPSLEQRLAEPALELVRQRVAFHFKVEPFSQLETRRYLQEVVSVPPAHAEMFPRRACREIFRSTRGVARAVSALGAESIRRARAAGSETVGVEHVLAAAGRTIPPRPEREYPADFAAVKHPAPPISPRVAPPILPPVAAPNAPPLAAPIAPPTRSDPAPAAALPIASAHDSDDPRVREWIEKFIKPGEPRFGEFLTASAGQTPAGAAARSAMRDDAAVDSQAPPEERVHRGQRRGERRQGDRRRDRGARAWNTSRVLATAAALIVVMAAITLIVFARGRHLPPQAAQASLRSEPAHSAASRHVVAPATRVEPSVSAAGPAPTRVEPCVASATPPPSAAPASDPASVAAAPEWFSLEVGAYATSDEADAERDRVIAATGLKAWRVKDSSAGSDVYRVALGSYGTEERAQISAAQLIRTGIVTQAAVIPLPSRRNRK